MNMKLLKKLHLLHTLLLFNVILGSSIPQHNHTNYYGNISTQTPFLNSIRVTVDIPNHIADICKGCEKPDGNCGAGLKCLCHAKECKDKVISKIGSIKSTSSVFFSLLSFICTVAFLMHTI